MNEEELKQKVLSTEFQYKCWRVLADILEDKYNVKIKVLGVRDEKNEVKKVGEGCTYINSNTH